MLRLKSFQTRLILFFAGLLVLVEAVAFLFVDAANEDNARKVIDKALQSGAGTFDQVFRERTNTLLLAARLLSEDHAFKQAFATDDPATILSALDNHLERIPRGDVMAIVSLNGNIIADTLYGDKPGRQVFWPGLLEKAEADEWGEAHAIVTLEGAVYQMLVVPLMAPDQVAWILVGFQIGDEFVTQLSDTFQAQISLVFRSGDKTWQVMASTLSEAMREDLSAVLPVESTDAAENINIRLSDESFVSRFIPMTTLDQQVADVVLQRSLGEELKPYHALRTRLSLLFAIGLVLSTISAVLIARGVTQPVKRLAQGVRRIRDGEYDERVDIRQADELGELGQSFNLMAEGLEEKEYVRDLLGKVVSPEIAEELLRKEIALGGEETEATILFSDVRNFTSLCENKSPHEILNVLNLYLTEVSRVIETHGGVVDKYIGDAVMALFGAPLKHDDDASRAVRTACGMHHALMKLNVHFRAEGLPELGIGIGINTAFVVAGNMGSTTRLNYTVIGDGVNLASRLEGLTKTYGVPVIVSHRTRELATDFCYRELDCVRVKGKDEPVTIYQPVLPCSEMSDQLATELSLLEEALKLLRQQAWSETREAFARMASIGTDGVGEHLRQLYAERIDFLETNPPGSRWDGVFKFETK